MSTRAKVASPTYDPLTGFGDHELLIADLTRALEPGSAAAVLAVFELVGWFDYRRAFGEPASDELIARRAARFAAVFGSSGACYRPRQGEFCALVGGQVDEVCAMLLVAEGVLAVEGGSDGVSSCFGAALLPDEADDPIDLLILADERLRLQLGNPRRRERRALAVDSPR